MRVIISFNLFYYLSYANKIKEKIKIFEEKLGINIVKSLLLNIAAPKILLPFNIAFLVIGIISSKIVLKSIPYIFFHRLV